MFGKSSNFKSQPMCPAVTSRTAADKLWTLILSLLLLAGAVQAFAQTSNTEIDFINVADTSSHGFTLFASFPATIDFRELGGFGDP